MQFTANVLNQFIKNRYELNEQIVTVNGIIDQKGNVPLENQNKVVISLIHLEQETTHQFYNRNQKLTDGGYVNKAPAQRYNIYILITPNFSDYNETLKFLSTSIQFFQMNEVLDATSNSDIPENISKLEFEFQKGEDFMQMQNLWTALGAKYQPSVIYKLKLITIDSDEIEGFKSQVTSTTNKGIVS